MGIAWQRELNITIKNIMPTFLYLREGYMNKDVHLAVFIYSLCSQQVVFTAKYSVIKKALLHTSIEKLIL